MKIGESKLIEELIFTSSERGLQIGKSGFCTVASTPDMAPNLMRMLESLSGYRHLFTPGSPEAAKNPVVYSFLQVKVGGEQKHVLSRVTDAGIDYSGRSNKLAHHIALPEKSDKAGSPTRICWTSNICAIIGKASQGSCNCDRYLIKYPLPATVGSGKKSLATRDGLVN